MEYKQLTIQWVDYPEKLNRTLLVRKNINLTTLAYILLSSLNSDLDNNIAFVQNKQAYVLSMVDEAIDQFVDREDIEAFNDIDEIRFKDLNSEFTFLLKDEQDEDEIVWEFQCKIGKSKNKTSKQHAFLLDGEGKSIWNGAKQTQSLYYDGALAGSCTKMQLDRLDLPKPFDMFHQHFIYQIDLFNAEEEAIYFSEIMEDDVYAKAEDAADCYINFIETMDDDYWSDEFDEEDYDKLEGMLFHAMSSENDLGLSKEEMELGSQLLAVSFHGVFLQMNAIEEVEETYNRLAAKYSEDYAHIEIAKLLFTEISNLLIGEDPKQLKEYIKKLEALQ